MSHGIMWVLNVIPRSLQLGTYYRYITKSKLARGGLVLLLQCPARLQPPSGDLLGSHPNALKALAHSYSPGRTLLVMAPPLLASSPYSSSSPLASRASDSCALDYQLPGYSFAAWFGQIARLSALTEFNCRICILRVLALNNASR